MIGELRMDRVTAPSLAGNRWGDPSGRPLVIYLPPDYAKGTQRFPTLYFLHGFTGSALQWTNVSAFSVSVPDRMDELISSGQIPSAIGVFIDGWSTIGGTQWDNSEGVGRYRDYVAKDVVDHIDRHLKTIPDSDSRLIIGKSSGGYGALVMGRHHPDIFGHLGCHSGDSYFEYCYLPEFPRSASAFLEAGGIEPWFKDFRRRCEQTKMRGDDHAPLNTLAMAASYSPKQDAPLGLELPFDPHTGRLRDEVWNRWLELDPVRFIPANLDSFRQLRSAFIDCGTRDEANLRWGTRIVAQELKRGGVDVLHEEFPDGHMGINYRYDRSLKYLVPRLSR